MSRFGSVKNGLKLLSNIDADSSVALMTSHAVISSVRGNYCKDDNVAFFIIIFDFEVYINFLTHYI